MKRYLAIYVLAALSAAAPLAFGATSVSLTVTPNSAFVGNSVTLVATVSPNSSTGSVTFYDGTTVLGSAPLVTVSSSQKATFTTILLPASGQTPRQLYARYLGDGTKSTVQTIAVNALGSTSYLAQAAVTNVQSVLNNGKVIKADFNNDGIADLAYIDLTGGNRIKVLLGHDGGSGKGDGTFTDAPGTPIAATPWNPVAVQVGDFNNDGKPDIAVLDTNGSDSVRIFLQQNGGTFAEAAGSPFLTLDPSGSQDMVVGDFNNDGKLDVAVSTNEVTGTGNPGVRVMLGNGAGSLASPAATSTQIPNFKPYHIAVGDLNGDGFADLVVGTLSTTVYILTGGGTGTFALTSTTLPAGGNNSDNPLIADLNGDGKPDIAISGDSGIYVFLQSAAGTFPASTSFIAQNSHSQNQLKEATDFDGDGILDLVVNDDRGFLRRYKERETARTAWRLQLPSRGSTIRKALPR